MILCLDVGNTHLYGGLFLGKELKLSFRCTSKAATSDELGIFLKTVLRENDYEPEQISHIGICSVVPPLDYSLRAAFKKYFDIEPFMLQAGVKTGLKIKYRNPIEVGADRIANAIAVTNQFPDRNAIVIDFGTATTFCAIGSDKSYLGGAIIPGIRLSVDALSQNTAKLPIVEIIKPMEVVGRSTIESVQSGVYFSALGAAREIVQCIKQQTFVNKDVLVIATGGFASLFDNQGIFDVNIPDLVLQGILSALELNRLNFSP